MVRSWLEAVKDRLEAGRETQTICGVRVRISHDPHGSSREHLSRKIGNALDLIGRYRPRELRRMAGDMSIWLREHTMCRAALYPGPDANQRICVLDTFFVGTFPEEQIASSVVHEAMHARLRRMGVPWPADQRMRAREERMCRRAELRLGLAIPNGAAIAERARVSLLLDDEDVAPRLA